MAASVPRQKGHLPPAEFAQNEVVGGRAIGRLDERLLLRLKTGHGIQAAAADDADFCFHARSLNKQI